MKICKKCIQPDTRPGIKFDAEGVCPACRFADQQDEIDWQGRRKELEQLGEYGRQNNVSGYDCIVGVSGGKDSTRQSIFLRDELGLKPLLVSCTYPPEQLTDRGAHNISNLISLGFDCISVGPDPITWKKMARQGFLKFGNWCKSTETALYSASARAAIAYHIPLICLGENPSIALGAMEVGSISGEARIKNYNTLQGGPEALMTKDITEKNLFWYRYPSDEDINTTKLKVFYLGYYIPDFTRFKNAEFATARGLWVRDDLPENIGDCYGFEALDEDFSIINQMLKYFKFGFGRATDQLSEAIRLKLITREEAVEKAKAYDGKCSRNYIKRFCKYIDISETRFWEVANSYRNKDLWEKKKGQWIPKWELK